MRKTYFCSPLCKALWRRVGASLQKSPHLLGFIVKTIEMDEQGRCRYCSRKRPIQLPLPQVMV